MFFTNLRRLWRALRLDPTSGTDLARFRPIAARAVGWLTITELLVLVEVYPLKLLIDALTAPAGRTFPYHLDRVTYAAALCLLVFLLYELASWAQARMDNIRNSAAWLFYVIINDFGNRKQLSLGADWHVANSSAKKDTMLSRNHKKVDYMIDNLIFDIVPLTFRIGFIAIGIWFVGWPYGLLAVSTIALYGLAIKWTERKIEPLRKEYRSYTKRVEQSDSELGSNAMAIKEQGLEDDLAMAHRQLLIEHWEHENPRHLKFRRYIFAQDHLITISRVGFYAISFWGYQHGLSIGAIVLANAWVERIYANIWRYGQFQYVLNEGTPALKELVELFETEPSIKQPEEPQWPETVKGRVQFKNVTFQYPTARRPAVEHINLTIEPGQTVALVGPSGGGKSTIARLLQHQYDPTHGQVTVDGVDLREIDDKLYRRIMLGSVPQEPGLFDRTILENIGMVRRDASDEEVRQAAREASANDFIERLPNGFDTWVGERGIVLSGGQRQRVAIARALLRRPPILVLDEPTSALDAESQLFIKQTLERLTASRQSTILIIAHRFSTIEMADLVVVVEDGRIVETGTHAQLQKRNGLYQRLRHLEGLLD
jgi:ABC-type multidrug transport system fused ATPase/permease subunit